MHFTLVVTSFAKLSRTVANNWKVVDDEYESKNYCTTVAGIIKERHAALGVIMKKVSNGSRYLKLKEKSNDIRKKKAESANQDESSTSIEVL